MKVIFDTSEQENRAVGYSKTSYRNNESNQELVDVSEDELSSVFQEAKERSETLDGADSSIDAAIDDPLAFFDYLILDSDGGITFDSDYARPKPDETQA